MLLKCGSKIIAGKEMNSSQDPIKNADHLKGSGAEKIASRILGSRNGKEGVLGVRSRGKGGTRRGRE